MKDLLDTINATIADCNEFLADMPEPDDEATPEYEQGHLHAMEYVRGELEKMDLTATIKDAIQAFVGANYGTSELDNPSWDIDALATAINTKIKGESNEK